MQFGFLPLVKVQSAVVVKIQSAHTILDGSDRFAARCFDPSHVRQVQTHFENISQCEIYQI